MCAKSYKKIIFSCLIVSLIYSTTSLVKAQEIKKNDLLKSNTNNRPSNRMKVTDNAFYKIQKSDTKELIIEITIPEFSTEESTYQETDFQTITIPGYSQTNEPGEPQLPVKGFLVGIPPGSNFNFTILDSEYKTLPRYNVCPAPGIKIKQDLTNKQILLNREDVTHEFIIDQLLYSKNNFFPEQIAQIGNTAFIRNQNVGSMQIFPIQFNPVTQEIRCYKKIKIKINFPPGNSNMKTPKRIIDKSNLFENLLNKSLLNYEVAKHWRQSSTAFPNYNPLNKSFLKHTTSTKYKILIEHDGIYHLNQNDLEGAGISTSLVDPRKIRIFNWGEEIPIFVNGQADGTFNESDFIEFYGVQEKSDYSYTNVYWLSIDEEIDGLRMAEKDGSINGTPPILKMSKETIRFEKEIYFSTSMPNGEGADHWFWSVGIAPDTVHFAVSLNNVANVSITDCLFKTEYSGYTDTGENPDHHTIVTLNGYPLLDDKWDGRIFFNSQKSFPQSYLHEGINDISVLLPGDTDSNSDIHWINWFEITYCRDYVSHNDSLVFFGVGAGQHQFEVQNFTSNIISVFDITEITGVKRITNFVTDASETSNMLKFQDDLNIKHKYYALTENIKRTPAAIFADEPSQLQSKFNQADYIIITHEDFYDNLAPLVELRQNQGLNVKTVKITDIYDEFNFGIKDPKAIKDFLSFAYFNWGKPIPSYVLLVGDASMDYKDFLQLGETDLVPTHLFESYVFNTYTSSDNWFVCVSGEDNLPDMLIGRMPVKTSIEAEIVINKILNYENNTNINDWTKRVFFVADDPDKEGNYASQSDYLVNNYIPDDFTVIKAYLKEPSDSDSLTTEINNRLNEGCLVTNYFGHGGVDFWAKPKLLDTLSVANLNNNNNLPFVVSLSCLNGYFHYPTIKSLSEEFLIASNGGAIGCFSPSGFANTYGLQMLAGGLYEGLFLDQDYILGSIVARSKIDLFKIGDSYLDHIDFYNYFGDPALHLRVNPGLSIQPSSYIGNISVENNLALLGSELSGWIKNKKYPANFLIRTPGKYGPIFINGDDPSTPEIEGGQNGDTVSFKLVTTAQDTFFLSPSAIWEAGITHNFDLSALPTSVHTPKPIRIEIRVNDKIVGSEVLDGDPIPNNSMIIAKIDGKDSGINNDKIKLLLNGQILDKKKYIYFPEEKDPLHSGKIIYSPTSLPEGDNEIIFEVSDLASPASTTNKKFTFRMNSSLQLERVYNYPNPMQTNTKFTYLLLNDKTADVNIKIYTVAGRLIKTIQAASGDVGYNETFWEGRDSNDEVIANGVYFYKIIAKDGRKITEFIERLVVMR